MIKSDKKDIYEVEWEDAHQELQREFELINRNIEEEYEKRKQIEIENMKKDLEEKFNREKQESN